jgi:putative ABC transport system permease protein
VLLAAFAALALAVAAVGLFGILAYGGAESAGSACTALGAQPRDIVFLVVRQGLMMVLAGLMAGLAVAAAFAKSLSALLYGVGPYDTVSFLLVPILLVAVAAMACYVPARRAARLDPLRALRA